MSKRILIILNMILVPFLAVFGQDLKQSRPGILFTGIVRDASSMESLSNTKITINSILTSVTDSEGTFEIRVSKQDTVVFSLLGYKPAFFYVSDTLSADEFVAGVFLNTDTLSIGEVIIIPRFPGLKSDLFKAPPAQSQEMENARYTMAISAYQGRLAMTKLGDPASNWQVIKQKQNIDAIDKGGIPSDKMLPLNPLLLIPAAYLLIHGLPQPPPAFKPGLTHQELDQINRIYLENLRKQNNK